MIRIVVNGVFLRAPCNNTETLGSTSYPLRSGEESTCTNSSFFLPLSMLPRNGPYTIIGMVAWDQVRQAGAAFFLKFLGLETVKLGISVA